MNAANLFGMNCIDLFFNLLSFMVNISSPLHPSHSPARCFVVFTGFFLFLRNFFTWNIMITLIWVTSNYVLIYALGYLCITNISGSSRGRNGFFKTPTVRVNLLTTTPLCKHYLKNCTKYYETICAEKFYLHFCVILFI